MGTKADITTLDGMRKQAHAAIDHFFNSLSTNPDGTPVDDVRLKESQPHDGPSAVQIMYGKAFGVVVEFARPMIVTERDLILRASDGVFRLTDRAGLNALVAFAFDQVHGGFDYERVVDLIDTGQVLSIDMPISDISRRTNLLFEPVGDPENQPVAGSCDDAEALRQREAEVAKMQLEEQARAAEEKRLQEEEERLAAEKRAADDTQQLTPEKLADLREESRTEQPSATDIEGAVAEDVVDIEDRRFHEDLAKTEPPTEEEDETPKSKRKRNR